MLLRRDGPDFVHADEFAYHVQFQLGIFEPLDPADPDQPQRTHYAERMADAFGAYYGQHARGATLQAQRIVDAAAARSARPCASGSGAAGGVVDVSAAVVVVTFV